MSIFHASRRGIGRTTLGAGIALLLTLGCRRPRPAASERRLDAECGRVLAQAAAEPLPAVTDERRTCQCLSAARSLRPELFDAKGRAVWDGRRTLRGVWVAHPMAQSARRVRIYNLGNGAVVDGALFKRDTSGGETTVIVSSDAAERLGLNCR